MIISRKWLTIWYAHWITIVQDTRIRPITQTGTTTTIVTIGHNGAPLITRMYITMIKGKGAVVGRVDKPIVSGAHYMTNFMPKTVITDGAAPFGDIKSK
jgi:hypothetical protein